MFPSALERHYRATIQSLEEEGKAGGLPTKMEVNDGRVTYRAEDNSPCTATGRGTHLIHRRSVALTF